MGETWSEIQTEIITLLDDAVFETGGSLNEKLITWANRIIKDICLEIDIRNHLKNADITITTDNYQYDIVANITDYFKFSKRFTKVLSDDTEIELITVDELNSYDYDHDETTTGNPSYVAIEGNYLYVYPMADVTLTISNYFRKPADLVNDTDSPDMPYVYFLPDLIIAGVVSKYGFPYLNEYKQADYWKNVYFENLEKYRLHINKNNTMQIIERNYY